MVTDVSPSLPASTVHVRSHRWSWARVRPEVVRNLAAALTFLPGSGVPAVTSSIPRASRQRSDRDRPVFSICSCVHALPVVEMIEQSKPVAVLTAHIGHVTW